MVSGQRGRLIAIEGLDGSGKSTQARILAERIGALLTFEPGDTQTGRLIRKVVLGDRGTDPASTPASDSMSKTSGPGEQWNAIDPRAEALLMMADRAQHVAEVIKPALSAGRWVVTDRFAASTISYQGYARGLDIDELERISLSASQGIVPDLYVLIEVDLETAHSRQSLRGEGGGASATMSDRMESEPEAFHASVARGFAEQARSGGESWVVVDGTGPVEQVAASVHDAVTSRLGLP